jgi:hypothetical protein
MMNEEMYLHEYDVEAFQCVKRIGLTPLQRSPFLCVKLYRIFLSKYLFVPFDNHSKLFSSSELRTTCIIVKYRYANTVHAFL